MILVLGGIASGKRAYVYGLGYADKQIQQALGDYYPIISDMKKVPAEWADLSGDSIGPEMAHFPPVIGNTKPQIASFRDNIIISLLKMHERL